MSLLASIIEPLAKKEIFVVLGFFSATKKCINGREIQTTTK